MKPVAHSEPDFIKQLIKDAVSGILETLPPDSSTHGRATCAIEIY